MDDLTQALASNWTVSNRPNDTAAQHPRYTLYKVKSNTPDQLERRRRFLEGQRKRRFDAVSFLRNIETGSWKDGDEDEDPEDMEVEGLAKPGRNYQNQLMLSEWLMEVPEDLPDEWLMVPCPVGRRALIVCSRGTTYHYTKGGYCMNRFPSLLPGGSRKGKSGNKCTILDCIYNEVEKTYYILDVMSWNGHPVYDSETEFRFYWVHAKCNEVPDISESSRINPYKFSPLPSFPCTKHVMTSCMAMPLRFELDGVLFYHKRTHYTFGPTPLVVWLKPFMLPDVLDVPVPKEMMDKRPFDYSNYVQHIQLVKQEGTFRSYERPRRSPGKRSNKKHEKHDGGMEVTEEAAETAETAESKDASKGDSVDVDNKGMETSEPVKDAEVAKPETVSVTPSVVAPETAEVAVAESGDMEVTEAADEQNNAPAVKQKSKNKSRSKNKKKK